jgi:hypothetical protein
MSKTIFVHIEPDAGTMTLKGRTAWALRKLAEAGNRGCTPIDTPGPRWSDYVFKLRRAGFVVETIHERHGGDYPGNHARYVLHNTVTIQELEAV